MTAAGRWRAGLEAWEIPAALLDEVDESPYRWPVEIFRRRNVSATEEEPPPTTRIVSALAGAGGAVLDVGAGTGRASIPLARAGHPVTGVERSEKMASALREEVGELRYEVIDAAWPVQLGRLFGVVMAAHVVYDVQDIVPFLGAMDAHARNAVVLELTETHPWVPLGPYYEALHRLERPAGPTVDDLIEVVAESIGRPPEVERWERPAGMWFESWDEIEALFGARLVLPPTRRGELRDLIGPDVVSDGGRMTVGDPIRRMATVWWQVGPASFPAP